MGGGGSNGYASSGTLPLPQEAVSIATRRAWERFREPIRLAYPWGKKVLVRIPGQTLAYDPASDTFFLLMAVPAPPGQPGGPLQTVMIEDVPIRRTADIAHAVRLGENRYYA